ncbi:MAG TPA: GNAT family protein [Candidatus Lokiarchaeia archaeon]|nr:GNAT family protein [Candidatus Lokiarchaeia archaeon]
MQIEYKGSPFIGERTTLRLVDSNDLDSIMEWWNTYETRRFLLTYIPYSRSQEEEWIKGTIAKANEKQEFAFAIINNKDGKFLGTCSLMKIDWIYRSAVAGIAIHNPDNQDKGYGSDSLISLLKFGFRMLNLHRIELSVFEFNDRAKHVYENVGFTQIGRKRKQIFFEGVYYDEILMDFLSDEFFERYP